MLLPLLQRRLPLAQHTVGRQSRFVYGEVASYPGAVQDASPRWRYQRERRKREILPIFMARAVERGYTRFVRAGVDTAYKDVIAWEIESSSP